MAHKAKIERHFTDGVRIIKRLWEHLNSADCILGDIKTHSDIVSSTHSFPNALSASLKVVTRTDLIDSAHNLRETLIWKWGLIVAIAHFDAWMEELASMVHTDFPSTRAIARSRKYNFATPSFNEGFFTGDKAGLGVQFNQSDQHLKDFVKWKEARNCLVHKGGRITTRFADLCNPAVTVGKQLKLSSAELCDAIQAILTLMKDIQRLARKQIRKMRRGCCWSLRPAKASKRIPQDSIGELTTRTVSLTIFATTPITTIAAAGAYGCDAFSCDPDTDAVSCCFATSSNGNPIRPAGNAPSLFVVASDSSAI